MKANEIIKVYREKLGISQQELADRIGISRTYVAKIEYGKAKSINFTILKKICNQLNIDETTANEIFEEYGYTIEKLIKMGIIEITEEKELKGISKLTKIYGKINNITIIKILNNYKNGNLKIDETIALLNLIIGIDLRKFMSNEDIKNNNLETLCYHKKH